ncbi:multidrug efflux pump subunit AcrB [Bosea sp. BE271]|uniref:efflux RND transporter permease subunit n=1 Tax=Bosea TaxID=85413 RepID=UPI00285FC41B|nr:MULTISPECIES: efflux RND transporter permease subunit [Bosea]MDR6827671.1 multidrug efflux pump subunit AcrB [Bosea robiniae]MDR6894635.1 multidrug efflux pump subunit AcrB [Bosea sp. BE109]MDR7137777.1 multidrug efflux pump subunit AcrB [Bosea sp. BE168]MDR7174476.1 multidrug efflux pump subunit AcrB [Bosea sp. BE271]
MTKVACDEDRKFNLSAWALQQQPLIIFLMLISLAAGSWSYVNLTRNEDPPFTIKQMVVSAYWPGATTADTTNLLTDKLEQKLEEVPYLDRLDSYTRAGESVIFVNLRDDAPPSVVNDAWYQVRKKVADIVPTLPSGVSGPFFDDEFGDTFGTIYGFTAEGFSDRELRDRLDTIRTELLKIPNVGKVRLLGVQEEQVVVEFSPRKLAALGLDSQKVMDALRAQNAVQPAGVVRTSTEKIALRVSGAFTSEESLRAITLRIGERYVPLTDLATISRLPADPPAPTFRVNGDKAIGLAISMAATGNLLDFGAAVKAKMAAVAQQLPHGIEVAPVADQSTVVKDAVYGFMKVLVEAILIVLAVSFLSLGTRAGLVVTLSIPLVLALTFVGMELTGIGLQRISLGALIIALGLLVDDAMITVEAMVSKLEAGWDRPRAASYAYESTAFPMLTGTLVMIAGFIPVGFAASSAGEYTFSLFMVVLISLSASWIVAVLFSPLLGTWVLPRTMKAHGHDEGRVSRWYGRVLTLVMEHRKVTIGVAVGAFALSLWGLTKVEEQFFPSSDRPELLVSLTLPQNADVKATEAQARRLEAILKTDPDVAHFSTYVGSGAIRFYLPMDVLLTNDNIAQTVVVAKGLHERDALRARLETAFRNDFPDLVTRATPLELGPPVGWPLKLRVTGPDPGKVRDIAMSLANLVAANPDTRDVNLTAGEPQRSVEVRIDQTEARAVGLSSQDVASALASIFSGTTLTTVRDSNRLVDVLVRASPGERTDLETVSNLQIMAANGRAIPLRQIAALSYGVEEPIIWRRQREAIITVQADVRPSVQAATVSAQLAPEIARYASALPEGYRIAEGGVVEESAKGGSSVFAVLPLMLLVMISLLMVQLRSFSRMAIALLMAPFGLIGVVAIMLVSGSPMGFVAQLGVIALAGMIIRNAVILIEEVDNNVATGLAPRDAIAAASKHRARPIILTACAAILGMVPIATQVFWGPMAYAIIGGLTVATALTLTLLPAILTVLLDWEKEREHAEQTVGSEIAGSSA